MPIFEEEFKKEIMPGVDVTYILKAIEEVHSPEAGWIIGEYRIEKELDGRTVLIVPLKKYAVNPSEKTR